MHVPHILSPSCLSYVNRGWGGGGGNKESTTPLGRPGVLNQVAEFEGQVWENLETTLPVGPGGGREPWDRGGI